MKPAKTLRCFWAIDLSAQAQHDVLNILAWFKKNMLDSSAVKWVEPEQLHVTLRFFQALERTCLTPLIQGVKHQLAGIKPFTIKFTEIKLFPHPKKPRVIAMQLVPVAPLQGVNAAIERAVSELGLANDPRPWQGHLTLGRIKKTCKIAHLLRLIQELSNPIINMDVTTVTLLQSQTKPAGAEYTELVRLPLS